MQKRKRIKLWNITKIKARCFWCYGLSSFLFGGEPKAGIVYGFLKEQECGKCRKIIYYEFDEPEEFIKRIMRFENLNMACARK